jgi:hypothetical protein
MQYTCTGFSVLSELRFIYIKAIGILYKIILVLKENISFYSVEAMDGIGKSCDQIRQYLCTFQNSYNNINMAAVRTSEV